MMDLTRDDICIGIVDNGTYVKILRDTNHTEAKGLKLTVVPRRGLPRWPWPLRLMDVLLSSAFILQSHAAQVGSVGLDYPQSDNWNSSQ